MRRLLDALVGACFTLLLAAVALHMAVGLVAPYAPWLVGLGLLAAGLWLWRAWQRSRW